MSNYEQQKTKFQTQAGFIAALDQSGGSTPKALKLYGIAETTYSGEAQMMDLVHAMRTRIITSPAFNGDRILAAILFEATMDRDIQGQPTADYLWNVKRVVPILKIDKGLENEANGVQLMKAMPTLDALLARAKSKGIFGTKERSVIKQADAAGIQAVVEQQIAVAQQVIAAGLVPIVEPEVDIHCPDKAAAEKLLKAALLKALDSLPAGQLVMLKLTLPEVDDLYADFVKHPRVLKVVALSGGYSRDDANRKLARQHGMVASFSRALTEGLTAQQSDAQFNAALNAATTPEQITPFYAEDAVFMGASSGLIEGHAALRKHLDGLARLPGGVGKEAATEKVEVSAAGDIGFALGRVNIALKKVDAGKTMVVPGKYLRVWKKQADGWKVTAAFLNYIPGAEKSQ